MAPQAWLLNSSSRRWIFRFPGRVPSAPVYQGEQVQGLEGKHVAAPPFGAPWTAGGGPALGLEGRTAPGVLLAGVSSEAGIPLP